MIQAGVPYVWLHKDLVAAEWPGNRVNKGRKPRISILNTRFAPLEITDKLDRLESQAMLRRGRNIGSKSKRFS